MATEPFSWGEGNRIVRELGREENLASRIAVERNARKWTQLELAREMADIGCPIPQTAISKIEKPQTGGRRAITVDEAIAFAKVFEIPFGELFLPTDMLTSIANARLVEAAYAVLQQRSQTEQRYTEQVAEVAVAAFKDTGFAAQLTEQRQALGPDQKHARTRRKLTTPPGWLNFLDDVFQAIGTMTE
jgi:transcriptional regulator with XRE-family HTH domain